MIRSIEQINEGLAGLTDVMNLEMTATPHQWSYSLKVTLANSSGQTVVLCCEDISSLHISEFGGGLTQFLVLRGKDVREKQLDRAMFHFSDLERGGNVLARSATTEATAMPLPLIVQLRTWRYFNLHCARAGKGGKRGQTHLFCVRPQTQTDSVASRFAPADTAV
jgi:hypothetical protein